MWSRTSTVNGEVTQQLLDMYASAAKGGVSMIIVEAIGIAGRYAWPEPQLLIDDVKFMPGLRRLVEALPISPVSVGSSILMWKPSRFSLKALPSG